MVARWCGAVCAFAVLFLSRAGISAGQDPSPGPRSLGIDGSYQAYFDYREDEIQGDDLDFDNYLRLHLRPFLDDRVSVHFSGRARADLDSESVIDEALRRSDNRVFQGYLELEDLPERTRFRLGRQWIHEVDAVHLDGARAELLDLAGFDVMAFGGRAVSAYSSADGHDIVGGAAGYRPFRWTTLRVTGVRSDEENPNVNDQVGVSWFQRLTPSSRFHADYRVLNRRSKDFRFGISGFIPTVQTELAGNYYRRINRTPAPGRDDVEGRRYSEFYRLLGSVEELDRYGLTATKYFGDVFSLHGGFSIIDIRGRENPANRDTDRYFGGVHFYNLFAENLDLSVTGNYVRARFDSEETYTVDFADGSEQVTKEYEREEDVFLITGELSYRFSEAVRAAVGSAYGDHDFDSAVFLNQDYSQLFLDNQRDYLVSGLGGRFITRTYFAEAWWDIREDVSARFLVEFDHSKISANNDTADYLRLVSSLTFRF